MTTVEARPAIAVRHPARPYQEENSMEFEFRCQTCDEIHKGMPSFAADAPRSYYAVPEAERASRCELGSDYCAIDLASFFVRGCLEIPVRGVDEPLVWGVWVSLSMPDFKTWMMTYEEPLRSHLGPLPGLLNAWF